MAGTNFGAQWTAATKAYTTDLGKVEKALNARLKSLQGVQDEGKSAKNKATPAPKGKTNPADQIKAIQKAIKSFDADTKLKDDSFKNALKAADEAKNFVAALEAPKEVAKSAATLISSLDAIDKEMRATCKEAGLAWQEGSDAATTLKGVIEKICGAVAAHASGLVSASTTKQRVASVKLLPMDATTAIKHFDRKALNEYVVAVEMELPAAVLDDLAKGVEGVSLAKMQDLAEKAAEKWKKQAKEYMKFADDTFHDFSEAERDAERELTEWTQAAGDDAEKAIQAHWNTLAGAHEALKSTKKNCKKNIAFGVVNLTASALAIAASFGTAAPAYVKLLISLGGIVSNLMTLYKSVDSAAADLTKTIAQLQKELAEKTSKLGSAKIAAAEVAGILGVPFLKTCESGEAQAKVLSGKCAELDEHVKDLLAEAEEGLKILALMEKNAPVSQARKVKELQTDHGKLMEKITSLLSAELPYFQLVEDAKQTIAAYKEAKDVKWAAGRYALKLGGETSAAKSALDNLKTVAQAVAAAV